MHMKNYKDLKDMLCEELEDIANKPKIELGDLDIVHKLTDTIKNIDKIEMLEDDGYSRDGGWEARGNYGRGMSYDDDGNSYAGRRRTRDGRYSRNYSRGDAKEHMIDKLEDMMDDAESEKEREAIKRCISQLKNA